MDLRGTIGKNYFKWEEITVDIKTDADVIRNFILKRYDGTVKKKISVPYRTLDWAGSWNELIENSIIWQDFRNHIYHNAESGRYAKLIACA